ncbi:zinc finger protein 628-like [Patiria miniata]|uniref:C2H2-type domain-containing protein n=1 Tax=Patiria miniata TaxID=46514 RepID=A0A913ZB02_PATMI|nr:zinc finger protein 628-like [Patiria miniata]
MDKRDEFVRPKDWHEVKILRCNVCGESFVYKKSLEKHAQMHETKIMFFCNLCERHYTRKDNLRAHYREHHPSAVDEVADIPAETTDERHHRMSKDKQDTALKSREGRKGTHTETRPPREVSKTPTQVPQAGSKRKQSEPREQPDPKKRQNTPRRKDKTPPTTPKDSPRKAASGINQNPSTPEHLISLSPASNSLIHQCQSNEVPAVPCVPVRGKPRGMLQLLANDLETSSDSEDSLDLQINSKSKSQESEGSLLPEHVSTRVDVGRVLKAETAE